MSGAVLPLQLYSASGRSLSHCTTVLIRPDVLLTAGHCFDADIFGETPYPRLRLTYDLNADGETAPSIGLARAPVVHPEYNSRQIIQEGIKYPYYDHDLAIVFLERAVPSSITPQRIAEASEMMTPGMKVTSYGFGISIDFTDSKGIPAAKLYRTLQRGTFLVSAERLEERVLTSLSSKSSLCQGDSGGPVFLSRGKQDKRPPVVVGINSAVVGKFMTKTSEIRLCKGQSVMQPLAPMRAWIDRVLRENGKR